MKLKILIKQNKNNLNIKHYKQTSTTVTSENCFNIQEFWTKYRMLENYYVYKHIAVGEVFYIGKGHNDRVIDTSNRSKYWRHIANKYGYSFEIVKSNMLEEDAFKLEQQLIAKYGRRDLQTGLLVNMTDGGEGSSGLRMTDEEKAKRSIKMTGVGNHMYGRSLYGNNNGNYGNKGIKNPLSKAIVCLHKDGTFKKEYPSINDAIKDGFTPSNISSCCAGRRKLHKDHRFMFKADYDVNKIYTYTRSKTQPRPVVQLHLLDHDIFIAYYAKASLAEVNGFNSKNIRQVCNNEKKSHGGYYWRNVDDLSKEDQVLLKKYLSDEDIV